MLHLARCRLSAALGDVSAERWNLKTEEMSGMRPAEASRGPAAAPELSAVPTESPQPFNTAREPSPRPYRRVVSPFAAKKGN